MKSNSKNHDNSSSASEDVGEEYIYQSAGIRERKGYIPVWFGLIALVLIMWAVYYLFSYWSTD